MTTRKFYKTVFAVEVLSQSPIPGRMELEDVLRECRDGEYSMRSLGCEEKELNGKQAARALRKQGSAPEFFQLTDKGEDVE